MNAKVNINNRAGASFPVRRMNFDFEQVPEKHYNYNKYIFEILCRLQFALPY